MIVSDDLSNSQYLISGNVVTWDRPRRVAADPTGPILDAAIARFGREGFRATSVADIARDAAVGGTVAYAYFPNKEALFLAAVDEDAAGVIHEGPVERHRRASMPGLARRRLIFTLVGRPRAPSAGPPAAGGARARRHRPGARDPRLGRAAQGVRRAACGPNSWTGRCARTSTRRDRNGVVAIMLSLLMSVIQLGRDATLVYARDVAAVFEAALTTNP